MERTAVYAQTVAAAMATRCRLIAGLYDKGLAPALEEYREQYPLSKSLLYELCHLGKLKHYRVGACGKGKILLDEKDIAEFLAACRVEDPSEEDEPLKHFR